MTRFFVLLVTLVTALPTLAEDGVTSVMHMSIVAQANRVESARNYHDDACYNPDLELAFGVTRAEACSAASLNFEYEMRQLTKLLEARRVHVVQLVIATQSEQVILMRSQYNNICFSIESLQAEKGGTNNDDCYFVRTAYETAIDDLVRLMHSDDPMPQCTEDNCPATVPIESN